MRNAKLYLWAVLSALVVLGAAIRSNAGFMKAVVAATMAADRGDRESRYPEKDEETIRKSFTLGGDPSQRVVEIDNVSGFIEVVGDQSDQVQMTVNKVIRAESKDKLEKVKKEVKLDITQEGGTLKVYVNGPFRCNCNDCGGFHDGVSFHGDDGYWVNTDFQLQVPHNVQLRLKTVNGGHVQVKDVTGNFDVHNVNGKIDMENVSGSGTANTINGSVKVVFRENPREKSNFGSINGSIDLYFAKNLSADFHFKTMNGSVFTDFPMTLLPSSPGETERRNGKFIYRANQFTGGRVGSGGPEITAHNLNGSIHVLERQEQQ